MQSLSFFNTLDWKTILFVAGVLGLVHLCVSFLNRESIRDCIKEMGGDTVSIKLISMGTRYRPTIYRATYTDKNGNLIGIKCRMYFFNVVDVYDKTVIEDNNPKHKKH